MVSHQCCIRVIKQGMALAAAGHQVGYLQKTVRADFMNLLRPLFFYESYKGMVRVLKETANDWDVLHVHNEPSELGPIAKYAAQDHPVVFDCHDLDLCRFGTASDAEQAAMAVVDALVLPSVRYQEAVNVNFDRARSLPQAVVYSKPLTAWIKNIQLQPQIDAVVYQGGVHPQIPYRHFVPMVAQLKKLGIPVVMYPTNSCDTPKNINQYTAAGALWMRPLYYFALLDQLTRYSWGYVGAPGPTNQWDTAMSNKMFDFLAAGIPVVVQNAWESARYVERYGCGAVVHRSDLSVLRDASLQRRLQREAIRHRAAPEFGMESQVPLLEAIYKEVLRAR